MRGKCHVGNRILAMEFAVIVSTDLDELQVWHFVRRNEFRAKREKSVEVLGSGQKAWILLQDVFCRHVQNQAVARDIVRRLLFRYPVTVAPDYYADLRLCRYTLRLRGKLDGIAGTDDGVVALHE